MQKHYGSLLRILHCCADQAMNAALETMDLTAAQGHIMGYLAHCDQPPCPRDIEEAFHLRHPTVSGLLSRLEKKDFVELRTDPDDRRCKRIYVLPKGERCQATMYQTILDTERQLVQGFTPEEQSRFTDYLERAIANLGGDVCHHNHKEDTSK